MIKIIRNEDIDEKELLELNNNLQNELLIKKSLCLENDNSCCNNGKICPCCIYSGNPDLPNLYNIDFTIIDLNSRYGKFVSKKEEGIYEAKL